MTRRQGEELRRLPVGLTDGRDGKMKTLHDLFCQESVLREGLLVPGLNRPPVVKCFQKSVRKIDGNPLCETCLFIWELEQENS